MIAIVLYILLNILYFLFIDFFIFHFKNLFINIRSSIKIMIMIQLYQIIQQQETETFHEKFDFLESTLLNNFIIILN